MRVMVVDDSVVFRSQIRGVLESAPGVQVVAVAANGKIAVEKLQQMNVDLITLDIEMPVMDGLATLREMASLGIRTKAIVFTAQSNQGASLALDALRLGAVDFVAKPADVGSLEEALTKIRADLLPKVMIHARANEREQQLKDQMLAVSGDSLAVNKSPAAPLIKVASSKQYRPVIIESMRPSIIVIGSSTGGPPALETLLAPLVGMAPRIPILICQHMPPVFTASLASRLSSLCRWPISEAKQGEDILPGHAYIAPGDFHLSVELHQNRLRAVIDQTAKLNGVRPAVDPLFESTVKIYGPKTLGFILTGMGEDGMRGAMRIKEVGGGMVIQDKETSVVWGMPGAVHSAGAFDRMASLHDCANLLKLATLGT